LIEHRVGRVAADPSFMSGGEVPGGWPGIHYWRWHGSPRIYYSDYDLERLRALARQAHISAHAGIATWCIFDNTAGGFALGNALMLRELLNSAAQRLSAED
ncbi:DUF72 domain-containing protein, partial [Pseudomonas sp. Ant30-3]|uniref:DUF72 domain-containing protein n=1 Tax=Pseudomonas sp. Ant30-3 TaxID=1488328 RepID=UPI000519A8F0